jgi:hypothetical protein
VRIFEISRIVTVSGIVELRHLFMRYRRGPREHIWDVDVVYLWSDPSDDLWAERRQQVLEDETRDDFCRIGIQTKRPTSSLDELRYSLRSVDRYLKGVRLIHIVVDGQLPAWLDIDHPKIRVVEAKDIITDPAHYPNYNTQAIESYFFNIPGLSDRFIYFNDDFFLRREMDVGQYYASDGLIRVRLGRALSPKGMPSPEEEGDSAGHKNVNRLLDECFGKHARLTVMHRPYAHNKLLLEFAAERFPEAFEATRASRFRSTSMYALHSFLVPYLACQARCADLVPPRLLEKDMYCWGLSGDENSKVAERIRRMSGRAFCIQEERGVDISPSEIKHFVQFMEELYPESSQFELPGGGA